MVISVSVTVHVAMVSVAAQDVGAAPVVQHASRHKVVSFQTPTENKNQPVLTER